MCETLPALRHLLVYEIIFVYVVSSYHPLGGNSTTSQYSIQAQTVLAEQLASLLDVTFGSQEKEKVVNILTSLLYNVIPYLRNHS